MSGKWSVYLDATPWDGSRRLFLVVSKRDGPGGRTQRYIVAPPTLTPMPEGQRFDTATLEEHRHEAQDLEGDVSNFLQAVVNLAWEEGFRPSGAVDQTKELAATRYHLEDMRKIAKVPGAS